MTQFEYTSKSEMIDAAMKDFKVLPYSEVAKVLNEATRKTLLAHEEAMKKAAADQDKSTQAGVGQNKTVKKAVAGQNKTAKIETLES